MAPEPFEVVFSYVLRYFLQSLANNRRESFNGISGILIYVIEKEGTSEKVLFIHNSAIRFSFF